MNTIEIISKIKSTDSRANGTLSKYFRKNEDALNRLIKITDFLPDHTSISERIYYIKHDLKEVKRCKYCNNIL